eukprot:531650_1
MSTVTAMDAKQDTLIEYNTLLDTAVRLQVSKLKLLQHTAQEMQKLRAFIGYLSQIHQNKQISDEMLANTAFNNDQTIQTFIESYRKEYSCLNLIELKNEIEILTESKMELLKSTNIQMNKMRDTIKLLMEQKTKIYKKYIPCKQSKLILTGNDPNVICMIRRKRASNLIVYRAKTIKTISKDNKWKISINPKKQIEIFWLKLSKECLKKHRKSGKKDDRVELTNIEKKFAYGVTCKLMNNNQYKVEFNAVKSKSLILKIDPFDSKPKLFGKIMINKNEIECSLQEIWVNIKKSRLGFSKVDSLTLKVCRCDDKQQIECVMKNK